LSDVDSELAPLFDGGASESLMNNRTILALLAVLAFTIAPVATGQT